MFHFIRKIAAKFLKRLNAFFIFIHDYKIILISILVILVDYFLLKILRNNFDSTTTGRIYIVAVMSAVLLVTIIFAKEMIEGRREKRRYFFDRRKLLLYLIHFTIPLLIAFLCTQRIEPIVEKEMEITQISKSFISGSTNIKGYISTELVENHSYDSYTIKTLEDIDIGEGYVVEKGTGILLRIDKSTTYDIGRECEFRGTLKPPENFGDFNYVEYLHNQGVYFILEYPEISCSEKRNGWDIRNALVDFKEKINEIILKNLKEPQSSLLMGIISGQDRVFEENLDKNIRICGVSHIVAASGYNITILIIFVQAILGFLPKKTRLVSTLVFVWMFCLFSGLSPSIVRAGIMASVALVAMLIGRGNSVHTAVPLTCLIFVVIDPLVVQNIGFILSVTATLGLIYISPIITEIFKKLFKNIPSFLEEYLIPTMGCTISTLPVTVYTFKTLSIWSIFSNMLILPVIEPSMILGILAVLSTYIHPFFSKLLFYTVDIQLKYFEYVVMIIGSIGKGYWEFETVPSWLPISFVALLFVFCIYLYPIKNETTNHYLNLRG